MFIMKESLRPLGIIITEIKKFDLNSFTTMN